MSDNTAEAQGITKATSFLRESVEELKKVQKPTRQETIQATVVTLGIMVFISLVLALFDFVFRKVVEGLL